MFLSGLDLNYSKFPYLVRFNEDSAVEPAHLTAISKFYYLLLLYYLSTAYMPVSGSASKCAIFAPASDGNLGPARRSESTVDAGIRLGYSISGSNVTFTLFTRNPVLVAMVSSGSVFSSNEDTYLGIIPANGLTSNDLTFNTGGRYYIYLELTTGDTYSLSYFPPQYSINSNTPSNVLKYSFVSLKVTDTPRTESGLFVELATAIVNEDSTITMSEEYRNYIWTPKVSYVPSGSYSSILSGFSGYDISTVLESILKYANSLPGLSAINGIRKGVLYRGNISNPLTVSVSSNDVYISAYDEWVEVSLIFGYKVFHGRLQELYEDRGLIFGQQVSTELGSGGTYIGKIKIANALNDSILNYVDDYVYALYYDPLLDKIHMGPVLKVSSSTGGYRYVMLFSLNGALLPTISNGAAVDLTVDDVKSLIYDSTITPPNPPSGTFVHTYNSSSGVRISNPFGSTSIGYIDNLEVGNIIPLVYVYKDTNGNIHKDPIFRLGSILPQDINLYVPGILNEKSYEDLLTFHSYSLKDFLVDLGKCIVSNSTEADDDINHPKHPILERKLVSLNENNRIDPSLLPSKLTFENSIVIRLSKESGQEYAKIDTLILAIEQAMIDAYTYKREAAEFDIVVDSDPSNPPSYIKFDASLDGVVRKVLNLTSMNGPFPNLQKLTLKILLPIKVVDSTSYYSELILNFDKQLSNKPVKLILDRWNLEGNGSNSNFEHTLILRIGSNSIVSYSSASSFSISTSNITLVISNFYTGNGAALKFSNRVVYSYNAYNSVIYYSGTTGLIGFPLRGLKIVDSEISIVQDLVTVNDNWWDTGNSLDVSGFIFEKDIASTSKYVIFSTKVITEEDISFVNSKIVIYPSPFSNLKKGISFNDGSPGISNAIKNEFGISDLVVKPNISSLFESKGQKFSVENCTIEISIPGSSNNPNLDEFVQSMVHIFGINLSGAPISYSIAFRDNYFRFPIVEKEFSCTSGTDCNKYYWVVTDQQNNSHYYSILTFTLFNVDEADSKMIMFFFSGNSVEVYPVEKSLEDDEYRLRLNYRLLQIMGRYMPKGLIPEAGNSSNFTGNVRYYLCWWGKVREDDIAYYDPIYKTWHVIFDNFVFRPYLSTTCDGSYCDFITTFNYLNSLFLMV